MTLPCPIALLLGLGKTRITTREEDMVKKETPIEVWHGDELIVTSFSNIDSYWLDSRDNQNVVSVQINLTSKGRKQLRKALK